MVPITEASLRAAMRDKRYWQTGHPERDAYSDWVTGGWSALEGSPHRNAEGSTMVFIRAYSRVREGRSEFVAGHWRGTSSSDGNLIQIQERGTTPPYYGWRVPGPSDPVGRLRSPIEIDRGANSPANINGRRYSGHALDRLQGRGLSPSVVENAVRPEHLVGTNGGVHIYWDSGNRVMVVLDPRTNTVVTAIPRAVRPSRVGNKP